MAPCGQITSLLLNALAFQFQFCISSPSLPVAAGSEGTIFTATRCAEGLLHGISMGTYNYVNQMRDNDERQSGCNPQTSSILPLVQKRAHHSVTDILLPVNMAFEKRKKNYDRSDEFGVWESLLDESHGTWYSYCMSQPYSVPLPRRRRQMIRGSGEMLKTNIL